MASSHHTQSEIMKAEQIVTEFFAKSLHIILESRSHCTSSRSCGSDQVKSSPSPSSRSKSRPRDKWFNLALGECSSVLETIDFCPQGQLNSMVVDVVLVQRPRGLDSIDFSPQRDLSENLSAKELSPVSCSSHHEEFWSNSKSEKIIERWLVHHERGKSRDISSGSRRSSNNTLQTMYKKSILLLRSLYTTIRLLPAHKIFQELHSTSLIHSFTLAPKVSSFVEPFTRREDAEMQPFRFTSVDTPSGKLQISVLYRSSLSDVIFEPSTPLSPQLITDYVGSPLPYPLKRFHRLPTSGELSNGSQSSFPYSKPHSWSHNQYRAFPPSAPFSQSPLHPEFDSSASAYQPEKAFYTKNTTYFPSSLPISLSPPVCTLGRYVSKPSLQPESAPVDIPAANLSSPHKFSNKDRGPWQIGSEVEKPLSPRTDDCKIYSGRKISSNSSPRISFSRSSSHSQSFLNDFDELPCPFDLDYGTDQSHRSESFEPKGHSGNTSDSGGHFPLIKSQDAAVGALVDMLKKAAPLRPDLSKLADNFRASTHNNTQTNSDNQEGSEIPDRSTSSAPFSASSRTKTTAEALKELQSHREMKILLLSQGGYSQVQPKYVSVSDSSSE